MIPAGSGEDAEISQKPPNVVFVVTVHNNAPLLERCLRSVAGQDYPKARCVVIDDASNDGTAAVATRWSTEHSDVFTTHLMGHRRGKIANFHDAVAALDPHDVVVELDGDDELLTGDAASDLARLHQRLDLVWTQHRVDRGPWRDWPHFRSTDLPPAYRSLTQLPRLPWSRTWHPSHLRSFKAWAFQRIDTDDLKLDRAWLQVCSDVAYFTPLVEMTPPPLRYFYDRELALYNITAQNQKLRDNEQTPSNQRQSCVASQIFARSPYQCQPAKLWIGMLDARNRHAVERLWSEQIKLHPATRVLLACELPLLHSWHPRVQILAQHTIARHDAPPTERARATMAWLEHYAAEHGYIAPVGPSPIAEVACWNLVPVGGPPSLGVDQNGSSIAGVGPAVAT